MGSYMAEVRSESINEYVLKVQDRVLLARNMSVRSNIHYSIDDLSSVGVNESL